MFTGINLNCSMNFINTSLILGSFSGGGWSVIFLEVFNSSLLVVVWSGQYIFLDRRCFFWLNFDMGVFLAPETTFCPHWLRTFRLLPSECIFSPLIFVSSLQVFVCLISFCSTVVPNLCRVQYSFFLYKPIYPVTKRTLLYHPIIFFLGFDNC